MSADTQFVQQGSLSFRNGALPISCLSSVRFSVPVNTPIPFCKHQQFAISVLDPFPWPSFVHVFSTFTPLLMSFAISIHFSSVFSFQRPPIYQCRPFQPVFTFPRLKSGNDP